MRFVRSMADGCLVAVCGPPKYSELRINLAQAFNGIGTVVAPVLGSYVFFVDVGEGSEALKNVQWVYLAIAIFVYILAVVFYFATVSSTNPTMLYGQLTLRFRSLRSPTQTWLSRPKSRMPVRMSSPSESSTACSTQRLPSSATLARRWPSREHSSITLRSHELAATTPMDRLSRRATQTQRASWLELKVPSQLAASLALRS